MCVKIHGYAILCLWKLENINTLSMDERMNELEDKIERMIVSQKETNDKLTLLFNSIVGDPLTNKKGWVSRIEENTTSFKELKQSIEKHDQKFKDIDDKFEGFNNKKSKVPKAFESLGLGGGGAIVGANFDTIIQFLKKLLA